MHSLNRVAQLAEKWIEVVISVWGLRDLDLAHDLCDMSTEGAMGTRPDPLSPYAVNPVCLKLTGRWAHAFTHTNPNAWLTPTTLTHTHSHIKELEKDWHKHLLTVKLSCMNRSQSPRSVTRKWTWMNLKENLDQYGLYSCFSFSPLYLKRNVSRVLRLCNSSKAQNTKSLVKQVTLYGSVPSRINLNTIIK